MSSFLRIVNLSFQGVLYYKKSFFLNLLTPLFLLLGQFALWVSLFQMEEGASIGSYQAFEMYTHLILAFTIQQSLPRSSENSVSNEIISGKITARCLRPIPFLIQSTADTIGKMLPQLILNFSVSTIIFLVFSNFLVLPSFFSLILALFSFILGMVLRMMLVNCFSLLCFFTTSHIGISWFRAAITDFFSGAIIPLALFPLWLQNITQVTPFPLMLQVPVSIFMGKELSLPIEMTFLLQIAWILVFIAIHELLYNRVRKNLSIAGG